MYRHILTITTTGITPYTEYTDVFILNQGEQTEEILYQ